MTEGNFSDETSAAGSGKDFSPLKHLMDAIHSNDQVRCSELLSEISVRQVNRLVRLQYPGYVGYTVTPLLWAVIKSCHDIVELLLAKSANADKVGTIKTNQSLRSLSPLLCAIQNIDMKMVRILLEKGARVQRGVPGERTEEEEGGTLQFSIYLFPFNICLGKDIDLFRLLCSLADMDLEYGPKKHTCLCYALEHFLENISDLSSLNYVKEVLNYGGKFCKGVSDVTLQEKKVCPHLIMLRWKLLTEQSFNIYGPIDKTVYLKCLQCLQLVSYSDYLHEQSPVYYVFHQFAELLREGLEDIPLSHYHKTVQDGILWIIKYYHDDAKTPSSLQHISRVSIRRSLKPSRRQQCEQLNLPAKLLKYIMFDED